MAKPIDQRAFPTAEEDVEAASLATESPQTLSPSHRLAFADPAFLLRDELRPVRLQLELLKPELLLQEHNVSSTIVVFGSARIPEPRLAEKSRRDAVAAARANPTDPQAQRRAASAGRVAAKSKYYNEARELARLASAAQHDQGNAGLVVVTGGGSGIMEAANRGAHEAGAKSIGLNIVLPFEQEPNPYITPTLSFQFHYFAIRKMHFLMRARALAIFPGGFGTMDELFDALTLIQTKKIKPIPILLFGPDYWKRVIDFEAMVDEGVISPDDVRLIDYAETAAEAWRIIAAALD